MSITVILLILFVIIFIVLFIGLLSSRQNVSTFSDMDFRNQALDQADIQKRNEYLEKMASRHQKIRIILLIFVVAAFSFPCFYAWFDTLSFKGRLDAESYGSRMRDNYLLMGGMLGFSGLFFFIISLVKKKMLQGYRDVIISLDKTEFEKMLDINQAMNGVDRFTMAPPFIISKAGVYVFKLGRVLVLPWPDITELKITSAPRNGYFIRMRVHGKLYFFTISDRTMLNVLEAECVQRGISTIS